MKLMKKVLVTFSHNDIELNNLLSNIICITSDIVEDTEIDSKN